MIPSAPKGKPVALYDTECYPNFWLLKLRPQGSENVFSFSLGPGERFDSHTAGRIARLFGLFTVVSFNGIYYDVPMLAAALAGYTCERLKFISDQIIVEGLKPWDLGLPRWEPADHIDISEVLPGAGSQKLFAGRIHYKTMRDLPYDPNRHLSPPEIAEVAEYCENDLGQIEAEYEAVRVLIQMREEVGGHYHLDLRSKSDAQCGEAILKHRCEQALGRRIYKSEINWNLSFRYEVPTWLTFQTQALKATLETVRSAVFTLSENGNVVMPPQLEGLEIPIGPAVYRLGIGGLHSSEKCIAHRSTDTHVLRDVDVASYYPNLMINSGKFPVALGPQFTPELSGLKTERLGDKKEQKRLELDGKKGTPEWFKAYCRNEGKKVFINGIFGKTLSNYSVLFAPEMGIQTTVTGQLALLMLIELHDLYGIPAISANTDGIVFNCPRSHIGTSEQLIKYWEQLSGLEMEAGEYAAIYSRDVNSYFAVKHDGTAKRKGAYAKADLVMKKSPDVEICSDAVEEFLVRGTPLLSTIALCRDIRKFVTIQKVSGGALKLWGHGPRKEARVVDMVPILQACGWVKEGRRWRKGDVLALSAEAYRLCFSPQRPEYIGKVIRWYYSTAAPGPIVYQHNGNQVSLSYGAKPCMTLPDEFPGDIDYAWYLETAEAILKDIGWS